MDPCQPLEAESAVRRSARTQPDGQGRFRGETQLGREPLTGRQQPQPSGKGRRSIETLGQPRRLFPALDGEAIDGSFEILEWLAEPSVLGSVQGHVDGPGRLWEHFDLQVADAHALGPGRKHTPDLFGLGGGPDQGPVQVEAGAIAAAKPVMGVPRQAMGNVVESCARADWLVLEAEGRQHLLSLLKVPDSNHEV